MQPCSGSLLVASANLGDPNFADTVVLLLEADAEGALGVVLNRSTPVLVADVLPEWTDLVSEPGRMHAGGPVGRDGALAIGRLRAGLETPVGWQPVATHVGPSDLGLVDLDTPVELVAEALSELRIYAGYAGWGPGQLEDEIAEGAWYVVPAEVDDIFAVDFDDLNRSVLRRQPGELGWASTRPVDPLLN